MKNNEIIDSNKIVLLAKRPGVTSFSSLFSIKKAFNTKKVGHTGTLDSFASGLLVVCCGQLTRLASRIVDFDKTYQAVIKFGEETDTLECTGHVIKQTSLPNENQLKEALSHFMGEILQRPPAFSALHVDGKRASDLVRSGKTVELKERPVKIFSSELLEIQKNEDNLVLYARIEFSVSKGTYIRSLARDIGEYCNSSAHLIGLLRTKVGNFNLEDSAGFDLLEPFTIKDALSQAKFLKGLEENNVRSKDENLEKKLQSEIIRKAVSMNKDLAIQCGFDSLTIKDEKVPLFLNGVKLRSDWFDISPFELEKDIAAVFAADNSFIGLLQKDLNGYFKYSFVCKSN